MGAGVSAASQGVEPEEGRRMTLEECEESAGFQVRLMCNIKSVFQQHQEGGTVSQAQFLAALRGDPIESSSGSSGSLEKPRKPPQNSGASASTQHAPKRTANNPTKNHSSSSSTQAVRTVSECPSSTSKPPVSAKSTSPHKEVVSVGEVKGTLSKKALAREQRRVQREKQLLADQAARRAFRKQKDDKRKNQGKSKASNITFVGYDETVGRATVFTENQESCSCLEGNPCVDRYACKDWENRFEVAQRNGWKGDMSNAN